LSFFAVPASAAAFSSAFSLRWSFTLQLCGMPASCRPLGSAHDPLGFALLALCWPVRHCSLPAFPPVVGKAPLLAANTSPQLDL